MNFLLQLWLSDKSKTSDFVKEKWVVSEKEIEEMFEEVDKSLEYYRPSRIWQTLGKKHLAELASDGLANFKRTLNQHYFHIMPLYPNRQFLHMVKKAPFAIRNPFGNAGTAEFMGRRFELGGIVGIWYVLYLKMFYDYTKRKDRDGLMCKLQEPALGNPLRIEYKGTSISFDICNSLLEYYAIAEGVDIGRKLVISELGAGYGRLAYTFLALNAGHKYIIFDIPPALYVSQEYLSRLFPDRRIFRFRHFDNFDEIRTEYERSDVCFFTSNQLALFPKDSFDLFVNISSLHEMKAEQIANYLQLIDKTTRGHFFTKQYPGTMELSDDMAGAYELPFSKYPFPDRWKKIYERQNDANPLFIEALFKL